MRRWCANFWLILGLPLLIANAWAVNAWAAAPRVDLVIGSQASSLEKQAADDIAADLKKIYEAQVTIVTQASAGAEHVIFVGGPESSSVTKAAVSGKWPSLKDQDHFLLTVPFQGKSALLVGGRSPQATYWAAAEYAHALGVRSMLFGDLYPVAPKPFSLDHYDRLLSSNADSHVWTEADPFPTGLTSWGLEDAQRRLRQLARLKFSSVVIKTHPSQPFATGNEADKATSKSAGELWFGWQFSVSGDTAGRAAFRGAKFFTNPDFAEAKTYQQRMQAAKQWTAGLRKQAESLGMTLEVQAEPWPADSKSSSSETQSHVPAFRPLVADESLTAYQKSRNRFGESLSDEAACSSLIDPICGDGVSGSIHKANVQMRNAIRMIDENDWQVALPARDMILKHYAQTAPVPTWWPEVRAEYLGGMNDMYRANSRARDGGRAYSLYLARRCEFGFEYINCIEATRLAAIAGAKQDRAEQQVQLEKAVESINSACAALAAVARDPSDRGMIALLNEFGYRPLQVELEKLDQ